MIKRAIVLVVLSALMAGYQPIAHAQISTTVQVCGVVTVYVAATQVTAGAITIGAVPYVIAAGTALQGEENIQIGAEMCLTATLNASLQITNGSIVADVESTVQVCGQVEVFIAATQTAAGAIRIGGVPYVIAAGTAIDGQENIQIGIEMCLTATLNALVQIVPPSSIVTNVSTTIDVCAEVDAYVAATSSATGYITLGGVRHVLAAGVELENAALIQVGIEICLHATVNVVGQITTGIVNPPGGNNHAPAINAPSSATVAVGENLHFSVVASDQDSGDTVTLSGSGLPAGATLTPNPAVGNPATAQFNFTPTASQAGLTFTVTFSANDTHGANASTTCQIRVTQGGGGTNHAPTISVPGPQMVAVGQTLTFVVTAEDEDGDAVTLSAANLPAGATFDPATGTFIFTPTAEQGGQTFTVVFTATDTHGASVSDSVLITVTGGGGGGPNHPPTLSVPGPQSVAVGATLIFTVVAVDPDDDGVTISATGVPVNASFDEETGGFTFTPSAAQVDQIFTVVFTASDGNGGSTSASVVITVTQNGGGNNAPPIVSVPPSPIAVAVDDTLTFIVTAATQIPDCRIRLSARNVPPHASFAAGSGEFVFAPVASQANQSFTVTFRATDCLGQTSTATVTIVVTDAGGGGGGGDNGSPCMSVTQVTFSPAAVGSSCGFAIATVTNEGTGTLTITGFEFVEGVHFRVEGLSAPMQLQPGNVAQLRIVFAPTSPGLHRDTLRVLMSGDERPAEIRLKGRALR